MSIGRGFATASNRYRKNRLGGEQTRDQMRGVEVVENVVDFEEVKVLGDYAFEWGTYRGKMRPRGGGETVAYGGNLMRILQRQPDGTRKMHRAIWTNDPPSP